MMRRGDYVALAWRADDPQAASRAAVLAERLDTDGSWERAGEADRMLLWTSASEGLAVRALPGAAGLVVGDLFAMPGAEATTSPFSNAFAGPRDPQGLARGLSRAHWGRYVALMPAPPLVAAVFRDPSGQLPALTWTLDDGLELVASDPTRLPPWVRPPRLSLDWARIARFVAMPSAATTEPLFEGVTAVGPGDLSTLGARAARPGAIWTPAAFVQHEPQNPAVAAQELVDRVDAGTLALGGRHDRLIAELSGGLDSAIVAGALGATGQAGKVVQWVNRVGERREGDERVFARAVTDRLGAALTCVFKPMTPLTEADFAEMARGFWPGMDGVDASADRDDAARLGASGAGALMSGQGGDAVFFQMPSALVMADALRARGLAALASPLLADVARRTHRSVWGVLAEVRADRRGRASAAMPTSGFVSREVRETNRAALHRWVSEAIDRDVAPGKRLQIRAIANCQAYNGESRRRQVGDVLFPLLAQPVVEHCLAIPTQTLAGGAYDRPFARAAFADRVPRTILERRSKGDLTAYWSQLVAASLPALRSLLLDGCLCTAGVLDRATMEQALDPRTLIWTSYTRETLWAASAEAWVRYWQGRAPDSSSAPRAGR